MDLLEGDAELTEFTAMDVQSIKGVGHGANGFPFLIMKGLGVADLPDADDAAKASDGDGDDKVDCPTCKGDGKVMGGKRDCPDCDATGKVTPAKAKALAAKSLAKAILADLSASPRELLKAVGADGQVDEAPDVEMGSKILAMLGQAIQAEAAEMAAGQAGEVCDIMELACAAEAVRCWRDGEQAVSLGDVMPASMLMQSAAKVQLDMEGPRDWTTEQVEEWVTAFVKATPGGGHSWGPEEIKAFKNRLDEIIKSGRDFSEAERKKHAAEGNALPDGSYPIPDADALRRAAILARSGHGDVTAAKKLIARRAKELGVANPLDDSNDDASKAQIAKEGGSVDTVTQGSDDLEKAVADAVTKATASLRSELASAVAERDSAREELAKVKATPVPGGPAMSAAGHRPAAEADSDAAKKAIYFDGWAERISDPVEADRYRQLAARERAKITTS